MSARRPQRPEHAGRRTHAPAGVIAVFGPTASGKSAVAAAIAKRAGGVLIAADAMQVYRGLPILTNQPAESTELVAIWPLDHDGSVGDYAPRAHELIDRMLVANRPPIVVGGTGLYLRAALAELDIPPPAPAGTRQRFEALYARDEGHSAHALLTERDPETARAVHVNDRRRVVRALELTEVGRALRPAAPRLWTEATRHPTLIVGLDLAPEVLAERIALRSREMMAGGAREEAQAALAGPISTTARRVIGLDEAAELADEQAADVIAQKTRRYAAYQRKWMRRIPNITLVDGDASAGAIADEVLEVARSR